MHQLGDGGHAELLADAAYVGAHRPDAQVELRTAAYPAQSEFTMLSFPNRLSFKGIWSSDMKMGARGIHLERTRPVEVCMPADRTKSWLDGLQVASPCLASWEEMRGDERERFCARCEKSVFNLSALTRAEAEEFLKQRTGTGACVLFYRRQDGTLITNDCPVGLERIRRRVRYLSASIAAACSFLFAWKADAPGLKWSHARDAASATGSPDQPPLDPKLLEELRHLGYVQ